MAAELYPDIADWSTTFKTNALLADIYDLMMAFAAMVGAKGSGKRPQSTTPYPRPWRKPDKQFGEVRKISEWLEMIGGDKNGTRG